jgi:hypothetical protein
MDHTFTLVGFGEPTTVTVAGINGNHPKVNEHLSVNQRVAEAYWEAFETKREELEELAECGRLNDQIEERLDEAWENVSDQIEENWRDDNRDQARDEIIEAQAQAAADEAASLALRAILEG